MPCDDEWTAYVKNRYVRVARERIRVIQQTEVPDYSAIDSIVAEFSSNNSNYQDLSINISELQNWHLVSTYLW